MRKILFYLSFILLNAHVVLGQIVDYKREGIIRVIPKESNRLLNNPGIGFMTFQRFNGDSLNQGLKWTEGNPIEYQGEVKNLKNKDYPNTMMAYFRLYWRFLEPKQGQFNWSLIDEALKMAHQRGQTLMLRIAPYGEGNDKENDVPDWYRDMVGKKNEWFVDSAGWRVDPEDPRYTKYFGNMITELAKRYDGHPDLEAVDLSIVGFWGEGRGTVELSNMTRESLVDAYVENFTQTPLITLLTDRKTQQYTLSKRPVGWRIDCLGDLGGFNDNWSHMYDYYPQGIVGFGMQDAWKKAPVSLEVCWVMQKWKDEGWDIDYIIDESLKWHVSSFNAKSSAVPKEWWPHVNRWLNKMGYRFVLKKFTYPQTIQRGQKLSFTSWWENKGVAPLYKKQYGLAIRLKNTNGTLIRITDADLTSWLPGDNLYDNAIFVPYDLKSGKYQLELTIINRDNHKEKIELGIEGENVDGWYPMGEIDIK